MMARMVMICVPTLGTCAKPAQVHVAIWDEHHGANVARRRADCPNIVQPDFAAVRSKHSLFTFALRLQRVQITSLLANVRRAGTAEKGWAKVADSVLTLFI